MKKLEAERQEIMAKMQAQGVGDNPFGVHMAGSGRAAEAWVIEDEVEETEEEARRRGDDVR